MPASLPPPTPEALAHSQRLGTLIAQDIIRQGGWIPFSRYMELALYAPGLGYYTAGAQKFGAAGDFITAPELSSLFGRTLARQVAQIMRHSAPYILELGAGSGKLALDLLGELERMGMLPERYLILEISADLRSRQHALLQQTLPHLLPRVQWLDSLPDQFRGAVIGNEVLDALPVHLLHWHADGPMERGVSWQEERFIWQDRPLRHPELQALVQDITVPVGYLSEISLATRGLVASLSARLAAGALLLIDYGYGAREYYHPQRQRGTLLCHYRHRALDDPFHLPGLQDITAHVDFSAVATAAIDAGLEFYGYTTQAFFLINCGITDFLQASDPGRPLQHLPLSSQLQKLTSPAEMGERFKVIALGKGIGETLLGFTRGDLSRLL